jgi:hypothetical protein
MEIFAGNGVINVVQYDYDSVAEGRLSDIRLDSDSVQSIAYDSVGRVVQESQWGGTSRLIVYDHLGRVRQIVAAGTWDFQDTVINQSLTGRRDGMNLIDGVSVSYAPGPIGDQIATTTQLVSAGRFVATPYEYDAAGRLIQDYQYTYRRDQTGRVYEVAPIEDSQEPVQYLYDAFGRIVESRKGTSIQRSVYFGATRLTNAAENLVVSPSGLLLGRLKNGVLTQAVSNGSGAVAAVLVDGVRKMQFYRSFWGRYKVHDLDPSDDIDDFFYVDGASLTEKALDGWRIRGPRGLFDPRDGRPLN